MNSSRDEKLVQNVDRAIDLILRCMEKFETEMTSVFEEVKKLEDHPDFNQKSAAEKVEEYAFQILKMSEVYESTSNIMNSKTINILLSQQPDDPSILEKINEAKAAITQAKESVSKASELYENSLRSKITSLQSSRYYEIESQFHSTATPIEKTSHALSTVHNIIDQFKSLKSTNLNSNNTRKPGRY